MICRRFLNWQYHLQRDPINELLCETVEEMKSITLKTVRLVTFRHVKAKSGTKHTFLLFRTIFNAAIRQFRPINSIIELIDWLITFLPLFYSPSTRFDRHSIQELFLGLFTVDPVQEDRLHAVQGPRASIQPPLRLTPPRATRLLYWYILSDIENYQKK